MKKIYIIALSLILFFMVGCINQDVEVPVIPPIVEEPKPEPPKPDPIEEIVNSMTLEEKIGQLIVVGIEGPTINEKDISHIINSKVGGFIFFARNIENDNQVLELLNSLKDKNRENKIPLFLSIDEEGGRVSRLSKVYKNLPTASSLGLKDDIELSYEYGEILGLKLSSLGFNLDFAPVLDINSNPNNPVIGDRAYSDSVQVVANNGLGVMMGINSQNIIAAAKHFPGHGDTGVDSHLELPMVDKSYEEISNLELIPFKTAIENDIDMIMVAHILFPKIDKDNPSTMSKAIIHDILRDDLDYNGVVISDDMTMGAIINNYSIEDASLKFLKSGGDIALICHGSENPDLVINRIKKAFDQDEITIEEIDEKVYRILALKNRYQLNDNQVRSTDIEAVNRRVTELSNRLR